MTWAQLQTILPKDVKAFTYDPVDPTALIAAKSIVDDVKARGQIAVIEHAVRLKDLATKEATLVYDRKALEEAFNGLTEDEKTLLMETASNIEGFAKAQRATITEMEYPIAGGKAGQTVDPMAVAGCYAPGGRYPLPSSVLMTALTAKVAGVPTIIVASPNPMAFTLAAAYVAGATYMLAVGGAQAIAAMAYGSVTGLPPCDIIVGPGNQWVTAAKSLVNGTCAIDMLAGPSECLVVADGNANAKIIAADLLAQAEHDVHAVPILVTTSADIITAVNAELATQLAVLPTNAVANESTAKGFAVLCPDLETCVTVSDIFAPEHLEILTDNARELASSFTNYGALFIGTFAAEVFGDYGAGPNHVLPTGGTARYTGGLSVHTFLRIRTWMRIDEPQESKALIDNAAKLARIEGLEGHARAAEARSALL